MGDVTCLKQGAVVEQPASCTCTNESILPQVQAGAGGAATLECLPQNANPVALICSSPTAPSALPSATPSTLTRSSARTALLLSLHNHDTACVLARTPSPSNADRWCKSGRQVVCVRGFPKSTRQTRLYSPYTHNLLCYHHTGSHVALPVARVLHLSALLHSPSQPLVVQVPPPAVSVVVVVVHVSLVWKRRQQRKGVE